MFGASANAPDEAISKAIKFAEDDQIALSRALTLRGALSRDEKEKISDLNQAIKLNPNNVDALRQRATYLFTKDQKKGRAQMGPAFCFVLEQAVPGAQSFKT